MDDIKNLFIKFLAKLHSMDEAAITKLVFDDDGNAKPDAFDILTTKEAERVKKLKGKPADPKALQDALKAERDKVLSEVIEKVKDILPEYSSDKTGLDFLDDLATIQKEPASKEVTDDDVKRHKVYRDMLSQKGIELKQATKTWEDKYNLREAEIKKSKTASDIRAEAIKEFKALNPILPEDSTRAERQIQKLLLDELFADGVDFQVDEKDSTKITVLKDGKILEDDLGHPVEFKSYVSKITQSGFALAASDDKGAGGNPNGGGAGGSGGGAGDKSKKFAGYKLTKPASDDEWIRRQTEIELDSELKPKEKTELIQKLQSLHTGKPIPASPAVA